MILKYFSKRWNVILHCWWLSLQFSKVSYKLSTKIQKNKLHFLIQKHLKKGLKKSLVSLLTLNLKYTLGVEVSLDQGLRLKGQLAVLSSDTIIVSSDTLMDSLCNSIDESLSILLLQLAVLAVSFRICFRKDMRSEKKRYQTSTWHQ